MTLGGEMRWGKLGTGCVPEAQADWFSVDHDVCRVVVEDGRDVLSGEGVCGVGNEQAGLSVCPEGTG